MNKYLKKTRQYKLGIKELSSIYGYANVASFRNSSAYKRILRATAEILEIAEKHNVCIIS